ncbi:MAG: hypothetical protein WBX25_02800 [Rhodomicrobium sp.]
MRKTSEKNSKKWISHLAGRVPVQGYDFIEIKAEDKEFPAAAKQELPNGQVSLKFLSPRGERYKDWWVHGYCRDEILLDFLNSHKGNREQNLKEYLNKYGAFSEELTKPTANSRAYETLESIKMVARRIREYVTNLNKHERTTGEMDVLKGPLSSYWLEIDPVRKVLVVITPNILDFLFLQIAEVYSGGGRIFPCANTACGKFMRLESGSSRKTCSIACRKAKSRDEKAKRENTSNLGHQRATVSIITKAA